MRAFAWVMFAGVVAMAACERDPTATAHQRPASATSAIARLSLHRTTVPELESLLGDPDERAPDGAFVYRFTNVRGQGRAETETVRLRFENGTLSKICRNRS